MSPSDSRPPRPLTCSDVRFAEVEIPAVLRPRMVIEFSEGLSLLLEDRAAIPHRRRAPDRGQASRLTDIPPGQRRGDEFRTLTTMQAFRALFRRNGLPEIIRVDNGAPFSPQVAWAD